MLGGIMATQVKPSSYYFRTITDDGIELVVEQIFKGERFFYFADNHTINRNIYHALATGVNLSIKLARATNARGDTTYTADTFPVSEKIYKALGGNVPTCEFTGCGGYVTLAEDRSARIDCTPKPKTRGEEVVAREYNGQRDIDGPLRTFPSTIADLLDREIAAAEKRGEERGTEKGREEIKGRVRKVQEDMREIIGQYQDHESLYVKGYLSCKGYDLSELDRICL
jgi:hypothetical protein